MNDELKSLMIEPRKLFGGEPDDAWDKLFFRWLSYVGRRTEEQSRRIRALERAMVAMHQAVEPLLGEENKDLAKAMLQLERAREVHEEFLAYELNLLEDVVVAGNMVRARKAARDDGSTGRE